MYLRFSSVISILVIALFTDPGSSLASSISWEFTGKKQPLSDALWHFDGQYFDLSCEDRNDVMYENYARLFPQFRPLMADAQIRKRWRQSLIINGNGGFESFNTCFHKELRGRWFDVTLRESNNSILYCGRIVEGLNEFDLDGALAVAELGEYAIIGRSYPVIVLVRANSRDERIRLNDDIEYYLQLHLRSFLAVTPPISTAMAEIYKPLIDHEAGKKLSLKKRKFLDDAFERSDHMSVLDTTAPCQSA